MIEAQLLGLGELTNTEKLARDDQEVVEVVSLEVVSLVVSLEVVSRGDQEEMKVVSLGDQEEMKVVSLGEVVSLGDQ